MDGATINYGNDSATNPTGAWQVFGPRVLMLYVPVTPAQTIITGFKATDVKSGVM